jgi:hypothetical protein
MPSRMRCISAPIRKRWTLAGDRRRQPLRTPAPEFGTTYYWQVNAIQEAESWDGDVWSFATQEYLVVDDFESYTDDIDAGTRSSTPGSTAGSTTPARRSAISNSPVCRADHRPQRPPVHAAVLRQHDDRHLRGRLHAVGRTGRCTASRACRCTSTAPKATPANCTSRSTTPRSPTMAPAVNLAVHPGNCGASICRQAGNVSNVRSLTIGIEGAGAKGVVYIDDIRLYPEVLAPVPEARSELFQRIGFAVSPSDAFFRTIGL